MSAYDQSKKDSIIWGINNEPVAKYCTFGDAVVEETGISKVFFFFCLFCFAEIKKSLYSVHCLPVGWCFSGLALYRLAAGRTSTRQVQYLNTNNLQSVI